MLYIISTPIGNLEDITLRALRILKEADVILCEDTRHSGLLLRHFEIPHKPLISYYDEVETQKMEDLMALLKSDQKVALISDAGTPLISDPGYKLVREALSQGVTVETIPGPSSVIAALTVSGMPPDKFVYLGYPPEKEGHLLQMAEKVGKFWEVWPSTVIFLISPYKLIKNLTAFQSVLGDRPIALARELTKIHEEVWRGTISEAIAHFKSPRGEFVLLMSPA